MTMISIIIPTYNRKMLLLDALQSVHAQTFTDYDVLVVDDGSTDDTAVAVAASYPQVRYLRKPNGGEASARNYGIRHAQTEYVAFLDSDDRWTGQFLATTLSYLRTHPDIALVSTGCIVLPGNERRPRLMESLLEGNLFPRLYLHNFITASAVVARRTCFQHAGLFDESLHQATDYDMWLRIAKHHQIALINQPLCVWRRHEGNASLNEISHRQGVLNVVTQHFDADRISTFSYAMRRSRLLGSLGRAYKRKGNDREAATCFSQALRLAPWRVRAWRDMLLLQSSRLSTSSPPLPVHRAQTTIPTSSSRIKNRKGAGWIARQIRHRFTPGARILCYHRVDEVSPDPYALTVSPECFAQHMACLRQLANPISLAELVACLRKGTVPDGSVAVTFDDGYASVLHQAYPILKRYEIPVTIFVTSGYLNDDREIWSDELEQLLLQPGHLPDRLSLNLEGVSIQWEAGRASTYFQDEAFLHREWRLESSITPTTRHELFKMLHDRLLPLPHASRLRVIDGLSRWCGITPVLRPAYRSLSSEELAGIAADHLIEIGAHSETHPLLTKLPIPIQKREIIQSRAVLEHTTGKPIRMFAYPYGARSRETISLVDHLGFDAACITFDDVIFPGVDPFQLPRMSPGRIDPDQFARRLGLSHGKMRSSSNRNQPTSHQHET